MLKKNHIQGDIILQKIEKIPAAAKQIGTKTLIKGEITGHSHQFQANAQVQLYELSEQIYVEVLEPAELIHEEHDSQIVQPGVYILQRQREVDLLGEVRKVSD